MRSSNWPRYFVPATINARSSVTTRLSRNSSGHIAVCDFLRQTFRDRGLADARLADQHRIILGAAAEHLNDALNFVAAPDNRIELAFLRQLGQVAAESAQGRSFDIFLRSGFGAFLRFRWREIRIELLQNFVPRALDVDLEALEHARGHPFAFPQKSKQNVLGADIGMIERLRFLAGERQNFFHPRGVGNVADNFRFRTGADLFFDFHPHGLEIEPHFLQNVHRHALAELDQSEQQMLGADVIVIETVGFLASELEDLLGAGRKIIHCSNGSGAEPLLDSFASLLISGLGKTFKRVPNNLCAEVVAFLRV